MINKPTGSASDPGMTCELFFPPTGISFAVMMRTAPGTFYNFSEQALSSNYYRND